MEPRKRALSWIYSSLALAAIALVVAGCGGSSSASTSAAVAASESAGSSNFASAEAVCRRVNSELGASTPRNSSKQETVRVISRHAAIEREGVEELSRLIMSASFGARWQTILGYRRTLAGDLNELARDTAGSDAAGIKVLAAAKARTHKALLAAGAAAGLKSCALVG
jgi:hypothetical protein